MIIGWCNYCKKEYRRREQKYKFCSSSCANRFNRNGVKKLILSDNDEKLAEFIGIMLGDGGLTSFQCKVYLNSETEKGFANYIKDLIHNLFGVEPSIHQHRKDKCLRVSISGVDLIKYLTQKGLSIGNKVVLQVGVPSWIWLKTEYLKACIRGLIDTDGSFIRHRYKVKGKEYLYTKISFTNKSLPLLDFMYEALKQLGFTPKRSYKDQVWLHSQLEVKRYLNEIGTSNYRPNVMAYLN